MDDVHNRASLSLLRDLYEAQIAIHALSAGVLVLTTPQGVRLDLLPSAGLYGLVVEFDDYVQLLTDCARLPPHEAEACAWRLLLAGHLPRGDD